MAALTAFYKRLEAPVDIAAGATSDILTVEAADLTGSNDYLVLAYARGTHVTANVSDCVSLRNEGTVVSNSSGTIGSGAGEASPYWFMVEITTDGSPTDISLRVDAPAAADGTTIDAAWLLILDATELTSTNYQYAEDMNNEALSTSTVDGASIVFTPGQEEDWLIISAAEFLGSFGSHQVSHWIDTDAGTDTTPTVISQGASASGNYSSLFARVLTLDASEHTILNQFVNSSATFQSAKRWDTIVAIRLDAYDDYAHTYTAAETAMSTSLAQVQTVAFTPAAAGDYFALGSFNADGVTVSDELFARVQADQVDVLPGDDGTTTKIRSCSDGDEENVITMGGAVTLTAAAHTIDMDASVETAGNAEERELVIFGPLTDLGLPEALCVTRADMTETVVRGPGGEVITMTLSNATWASTIGDPSVETDLLIGGLLSAGTEALGWNAVVTGAQYATEVLSDSPIVYLPMDETSGTSIADLGSAGATATAGAGVVLQSSRLLNSSKRKGMRFGDPGVLASSTKITVTAAAAFEDLFDGGGTAEAIVRPAAAADADGTAGVLMSTTAWRVWFHSLADGKVAVGFSHDFSTTDGIWHSADVTVPLGMPLHIAVTYDASDVANDPTIYLNGVALTTANNGLAENSTPVGTFESDSGQTFNVGGLSVAPPAFRGEACDVALYGSELTQATIVNHLAAASAPTTLTSDDVVRTSATVVTVTLPAFPIFDITVDETITPTAVAETHSGSSDTTASCGTGETFDITADSSSSGYTPPADAGDTPTIQDPGAPLPFGNYNGGLGPDVIGATRDLGAGDQWQVGNPTMSVGLLPGSQVRLLQVEAVEISSLD